MDGFNVAQRRLEAVVELAAQEGYRAGLEPRQIAWVMQAAKVALIREGSAWRALEIASAYAKRLAREVA
jgi:hypothetical protein